VKKVNKKSPALRKKISALLCIFSGQTAHNPQHYIRNARITKIESGAMQERGGSSNKNLQMSRTFPFFHQIFHL
jgi:hypothetical protein